MHDSSCGLEMYIKVFIGRLAVLCKFLGVGHCLKNHWCWELSSLGQCYDIFHQMLAVGLSVMGWYFVCQMGFELSSSYGIHQRHFEVYMQMIYRWHYKQCF